MSAGEVLHETARRLRWGLASGATITTLSADLKQLPGVASVRVNAAVQCVVVRHDGRPETRSAVMGRLQGDADLKRQPSRPPSSPTFGRAELSAWAPGIMAATLPLLPSGWRRDAALAVIATRVLSQPARLRADAPAVLLDAASLAALAVNGQPLVVSTSVLLRLLSERLSARLVRQADSLLDHLLPTEAPDYTALRETADGTDWASRSLSALRAGDRLCLSAGDVVPVDGWVVDGSAMLAAAAQHGETRAVALGAHVAAGERLHQGALQLLAEADVAASRLARLRAHVHHAMSSPDPAGRMAPGLGRLLSLPLTAATLVFGLTGDSARAAAMLQADPQQGLDLALPLGREAALYALARHGLLMSGLETIERFATARTLVLQDTGVLATGRWTVEALRTEPGGDVDRVRGWLAALAGTPVALLDAASFPDRVVRQWVRHGALLRLGEHELHLASRQRLRQVWRLAVGDPVGDAVTDKPPAAPDRLRHELAIVASGRVVAWVVLASPLRPAVAARLGDLAALGFERIALFAEAAGASDGTHSTSPDPGLSIALRSLESVSDDAGLRADWLAGALQSGTPLVMVHTVLRDLVPPGSLSLSPVDSDAGSHGILLGDPLLSLVAARRIAQQVHRRLRLQQGTAVAANAGLMTAAALRWLPPLAITLLHHGHALLLLLDSLRIESLDETLLPHRAAAPRGGGKVRRSKTTSNPETPRSETE